MSKYHCKHCGKTLLRESNKAWVKSFCASSGKTVHLMKIALEKLPESR